MALKGIINITENLVTENELKKITYGETTPVFEKVLPSCTLLKKNNNIQECLGVGQHKFTHKTSVCTLSLIAAATIFFFFITH